MHAEQYMYLFLIFILLEIKQYIYSYILQGISPGEGNGNPLQYPHLEKLDKRAWWATVHGVAKSLARLGG